MSSCLPDMADDFVFEEKVKIYDTDAQGVVHYAGYYRFFTDALESFSSSKLGETLSEVSKNIWFVVVESNAKYYKPARMGDKLDVHLSYKLLSDKSIRFDFKIFKSQELVCEGFITQVSIDRDEWKTTPIPREILDKLA